MTAVSAADRAADQDPPSEVRSIVFDYREGERIVIPFCGTQPLGEVYRWAPLAILIRHIECDGVAIQPSAQGVNLNFFDESARPVEGSSAVYLLDPQMLISVGKYDKASGEYSATMYSVPRKFQRLVIRYSVRTPKGESTDSRQVELYAEPK